MPTGNGDINKPNDVESAGTPPAKEGREATKKIIRVLTVMAYLSSVSMAAIMLSLYYIFLWNPMPSNAARTMPSALPEFPLISTTIPPISLPERILNRTWLAPEEPRALPVQIAEPPQLAENVASLHSDEDLDSWESQEKLKIHRGKRAIRKVLNVLKVAQVT